MRGATLAQVVAEQKQVSSTHKPSLYVARQRRPTAKKSQHSSQSSCANNKTKSCMQAEAWATAGGTTLLQTLASNDAENNMLLLKSSSSFSCSTARSSIAGRECVLTTDALRCSFNADHHPAMHVCLFSAEPTANLVYTCMLQSVHAETSARWQLCS